MRSRLRPGSPPVPGDGSGRPRGVASVDRAFVILAAFRPDDRSLSLAELAARTGLYKSTILRSMASLQRHEYILRLANGQYQLGPMPFIVGAVYQRSLVDSEVIVPLMEELSRVTGESTTFFVPHGELRICLHRIDSRHEIREHLRAGDTFPMSRGSPGAVLSAFSGAKGRKFDRIRAAHRAISYGEHASGLVGASAPVFGALQRLLGSITVSGPKSRIEQRALEQGMSILLLQAAAQATRALGGDARPLEQSAAASTDIRDLPAEPPLPARSRRLAGTGCPAEPGC
ncbi:MAG: IclR family transcriptional regulator [Lautropia sp.]